MFHIGEFARLNGVSARMLRAWDARGVFRPAWVDAATGYRGYSPAQIPELRRLLALRDLGVSLDELARLVDGGADLRGILQRRRLALERERREVDRRLRALDISVEDGTGEAPTPGIVIRPLEPERVAMLAVPPQEQDLNAAFYALEAAVRDRRRRAPGPPGALEHRDGRVEVYVPVIDRGTPRDGGAGIAWTVLPAATAATLIHRGPYEGLGAAAAALERGVAAAGHTTAGRLRVVYLQFGAEPELRVPTPYLVRREADYVTELQLELLPRAVRDRAGVRARGRGTARGATIARDA